MDGTYKYGMRLRGFAPGCQPMEGFISAEDGGIRSRYYSVLHYSRPLTQKELDDYELDDLEWTGWKWEWEI